MRVSIFDYILFQFHFCVLCQERKFPFGVACARISIDCRQRFSCLRALLFFFLFYLFTPNNNNKI